MTKENLLRQIELKEEGIEHFLAERETLEYDLDLEELSLTTKRRLEIEINEIDFKIWTLRSGIKILETKLKRGGF